MITRRNLLAAGAAAVATGAAADAFAQAAFPNHPIRIVVPWTAGGTGDIQARIIGQHMSQALGQPVIIENRPGGGTIIGTGLVAKSPADGHTLLMMANSFVINAKLHATSLPYEGLKAFEPVVCLTNSPQVIAVNAGSPYKTFKEWVDAARAKPGTISYATVGPATTQHIAGEMLQRAAGIKLIYTPFGGGAPAVNAVLAGHVDTVLANLSEMNSFLDSGKMRALAVTTRERLDSLKQVPTVAETYPGYEAAAWFGLSAPVGTPKDAIAKLSKAALAAISDADIKKKLLAVGLDPYPMGPAEFAGHVTDQFAKYSKVIDEAGIKA